MEVSQDGLLDSGPASQTTVRNRPLLNRTSSFLEGVVDSKGRLAEASGDLRRKKAPRNGHQQRKVGNSTDPKFNDEGGHLIGTQFDGLGEGTLHMAPQKMELNRGKGSKWRAMETEWANELDSGNLVNVKIEVEYPAKGDRPKGFIVTYNVTDAKTGMVSESIKYFKN